MAHRRSRRNRAYLRRIWFLRNFLNLLNLYRAYLYRHWKHFKRLKKAIEWRNYEAICWKTFALRWNLSAVLCDNNYESVIYRFFNCQLTTTLTIIDGVPSLFLLMHDELIVDKFFVIFLPHETVLVCYLHAFLSTLQARRKLTFFLNLFNFIRK